MSTDLTVKDGSLPDIDWALVPPGITIGVFDAPSGRLATASMGDPRHPRVVLVPGVTGSKEDFWFMMPLLVAAGYHVQSYDLAGQYESADAGPWLLDPPREHYDYALFVDDLIAFLRAGEPAHVLGYSFAGIVAQCVVEREPELVRSLTLLSTPPLSGQSFRGVRIIGALSRIASPAVIAALMKWGVVNNLHRVTPMRLTFIRDRFQLTRHDSHVDVMRLMKNVPNCDRALAESGIPIAIAVGDHDLWPLRLHRRFAQRIGASIHVYRTGHSPCETAPHQLSRDLIALCEKAAESGPEVER
ncbi:alpha/beta hydrolase [Okibacterium endophyticum]